MEGTEVSCLTQVVEFIMCAGVPVSVKRCCNVLLCVMVSARTRRRWKRTNEAEGCPQPERGNVPLNSKGSRNRTI